MKLSIIIEFLTDYLNENGDGEIPYSSISPTMLGMILESSNRELEKFSDQQRN